MKRSVALLGGDSRQVHLARMLLADGWAVSTWGLEKGDGPCGVPLQKAVEPEIVILPLPVCREGKLYLPLTDTALEVEKLWPKLRYDQLLLGGMTGELTRRLMLDYGLTLVDYYQREEVQIANAVPTAEGAIQRAMEATERTLCSSRCLVIGYGRIGKVLAQRLKALGAEVTVAARKYSDLAWIEALGYQKLPVKDMDGAMERFHLIFNTAPSTVLAGALLRQMRPDSLIIELASPPGGIDREVARQIGRNILDAPGLPGIVAPQTAATAIFDGIYHILEERGELF